MEDSFSEVRNLVVRNSKPNKIEKIENNYLLEHNSNNNFKVKAENLELRVISRNIKASTTPREDVSILKKGKEHLENTIQMSHEPRKALEYLLKRVNQQIELYNRLHKIGGFRNKTKKNSKRNKLKLP
jgi:hypothetical protein